MNKIVDLKLPEVFNKEKAIEELNKKYNIKYNPCIKLEYVRDYVKELDEIENRKSVYDKEFWEKVKDLNKEKLAKINYFIDFAYNNQEIYFNHKFVKDYSPNFKFNEIDLINKQYRLLQEIYYTRLKDNNE